MIGNYKKSLTVKNMVDVYMHANANSREVWNAYKTMMYAGFITGKMWDEFYNKCHSWVWDSSLHMMVVELI